MLSQKSHTLVLVTKALPKPLSPKRTQENQRVGLKGNLTCYIYILYVLRAIIHSAYFHLRIFFPFAVFIYYKVKVVSKITIWGRFAFFLFFFFF